MGSFDIVNRVDGASSARERILSAAATLVERSPWERVTTRMVCAAADVTAPTLYHHFGDKAGLATALADHAFRTSFTGRRSRAHSDDPIEILRFAWDAHVQFGLEHRWLYSVMFGESRPDESLPGALIARGAFLEVLRLLDGEGALGIPVERAALVIEAAVVGMTFQAIRSGLDAAASAHMREAILASLSPRAAR